MQQINLAPASTKRAKYTRWLHMIALFVLLAGNVFSVSQANSNMVATAPQLYSQAAEAVFAPLDHFRVNIKATLNGQMLGNTVVGWNSGMELSASVVSPMMGPWYTDFAIRPSGFVLMRVQGNDYITADWVAKDSLFQMLPRVFNASLVHELIATLSADASLTGTTTVAERPVQILSANTKPVTYTKALIPLIKRLRADPSRDALYALLGEMLERSPAKAAAWLSSLPAMIGVALTRQPLPATPLYIDEADGIVIGVDTTAWLGFFSQSLQIPEKEILTAVPQFTISDVKTDQNGHIASLSLHFQWSNMEVFDQLSKRVQQKAAAGEDANSGHPVDKEPDSGEHKRTPHEFGFVVTLQRTEGRLLPTLARIWSSQYSGDVGQGDPESYEFEFAMKWDLSKGADKKITEYSKLIAIENAWSTARTAVKAKDFATAQNPAEQVVKLAPTFMDAQWMLADIYKQTGQTALYKQVLAAIQKLQPDNPDVLNNLAYIYADEELDVKLGLELARKSYEMADEKLLLYVTDTLGWALYRNGMLDEAAATLRDAVKLSEEAKDPDAGITYYHLAMVLHDLGQSAEALNVLEKALTVTPGLPEAQELLAKIKQELEAKPD